MAACILTIRLNATVPHARRLFLPIPSYVAFDACRAALHIPLTACQWQTNGPLSQQAAHTDDALKETLRCPVSVQAAGRRRRPSPAASFNSSFMG